MATAYSQALGLAGMPLVPQCPEAVDIDQVLQYRIDGGLGEISRETVQGPHGIAALREKIHSFHFTVFFCFIPE